MQYPCTLLPLALMFGCAQMAPHPLLEGLEGTSWQLVQFQSGNGLVLTPNERSAYTVAFAADGSVSVRFDCNRGRGTWKSVEPARIEFGPLALTRAMCPPGSLYDTMVKQWPFVRSYVIKGGHLFLSLMADGGILELEPMPQR